MSSNSNKLETLYPLLFENNFHELVWGGNNICPMKGLPKDERPIGESWEVSAIPNKESIVANGTLRGMTLAEVTNMYGPLLLGEKVYARSKGEFPLLIKFIDAKRDLSIQVHPDDKMAKEVHGGQGKTEMWYVMDAEPGAILYAGFKSPISEYEYHKRVEDGSICDVLAEHEVKVGDVFFIPSGRIHAICGGLMIAEIQQSSDITYRIFDYNRPGLDGKPRQLHTELAAKAIDYKVYDDYRTHYVRQINKPVCISECEYFTVKVLEVSRAFHRKLYKYDSFVVYMCLEGDADIKIRSWEKFDRWAEPGVTTVHVKKGNSCLIPAGVADFNVIPNNEDGVTKLLEVYVNGRDF
ncbi:MAG: class I mannose-6-phosphate isomerase [Bacteroidales bacterium]|nr:class I mannose-6-phosphate isomerase [Bacteroidales bacterium]